MKMIALILGFCSLPSLATPPHIESWLQKMRMSSDVIPPEPAGQRVAMMYNREAVIPPQCYTRSEGRYNACYVCHQSEIPGRENIMNDLGLQQEYSFSDLGFTNQWRNLHEDRRQRIASISDEEMSGYVKQDNYSELPERLRAAHFSGWIPDMKDYQNASSAVDPHGHAKDGSGWVAFHYKPFPSTFWPTNGSFDDVLIRLDSPFRRDASGQENRDTYQANLTLLECAIKGLKQIESPRIDESKVGTDLDADGVMGIAQLVRMREYYLGGAAQEKVEPFLYPKGTEFMHGIRYLEDKGEQGLAPSTRLKELRYMKKWRAYGQVVYHREYDEERYAKEAGNLPGYTYLGTHGYDNGTGWSVSGFIEDAKGRLRALAAEENFSCMGCHNSIGSTIDKTFSFARKPDGAKGWGYIDLKTMRDAPSRGEDEGEFLLYLKRVGGGSEFRNNDEMQQRWFNREGEVDADKVKSVPSIAELIIPSKERAMMLNKAYRCIVEDQDFIFGKDATWIPPVNVYEKVDPEQAPTLPENRVYPYNLILDWNKPSP